MKILSPFSYGILQHLRRYNLRQLRRMHVLWNMHLRRQEHPKLMVHRISGAAK